jgi:hypothetical protein
MAGSCSLLGRLTKRSISSYFWFSISKDLSSNRKSAICMSSLRFVFLLISLVLVILWVCLNEGYVRTSDIQNSLTVTDQYGYFYTNFSRDQFDPDAHVTDDQLAAYNRYWAPNDYIRQSSTETTFSILTNFGITNVTKGICPEDPQYDVVICNPKDIKTSCSYGKQSPNGIQTGKCVLTTLPLKEIDSKRRYVCEVIAWCPVAIWPPLKEIEGAVLAQTSDTVLSIQNFIEIPEFNLKMGTADRPTLDCLYDPVSDELCPYFKLKDIVKYSSGNTKNYEEIATKSGAIFEIRIEWNCSFGFPFSQDKCEPEFSFWRSDNENSNPPPLWAFWQFEKLTPEVRILTYGWRIKFEIITNGFVKKFSWFKLLTYLFAYGSFVAIALSLFTCLVRCCTRTKTFNEDKVLFCDLIVDKLGLRECFHDEYEDADMDDEQSVN